MPTLPNFPRAEGQTTGNVNVIDLVLVPECGTTSTKSWAIQSQQWNALLAKSNIELQISTFLLSQPVYPSGWKWIVDAAASLLTTLQESRDWSILEARRPLMIMTHGTSGAVVKQMLCQVSWNTSEYAPLGTALVGAIFLGTPHRVTKEMTIAEQFIGIRKPTHPKGFRKAIETLKQNDQDLIYLAQRFEGIELEIELLTIHESRAASTVPSLRRSSSGKKKSILEPEATFLNMPREKIVALNTDHDGLCQLTAATDQVHHDVAEWMEEVAGAAYHKVMSTIRRAQPTLAMRDAAAGVVGRSMIRKDRNELPSQVNKQMKDLLPRPQPRLPILMINETLKNSQFFGREAEMKRLDKVLLPSQNQIQPENTAEDTPGRRVTILGLPGVGKTELAAAYAFSRASNFDATFWCHADTIQKLENDFAEVARQLQLGDPDEVDAAVLRDQAKGWLANPKKVVNASSDLIVQADASWLLILDNADSPAILGDYFPSLLTGSVLVTSRRPPDLYRKEINMRPMHIEELPPFDAEDGATLIRNWTGCTEEFYVERSLQISRILGGLPLALLQCADMVRGGSSFILKDFLEWHQLREERPELVDFFENRPLGLTPRGTIAATWAIQSLSLPARAFLEVLTFLDPDKIQEPLFRASGIDRSIMLADFPQTFKELLETREEMINRAFVKLDLRDKQEFRVHRSVQEIFRFYMSQERMQQVFQFTVALLEAHWGKEYNSRSHSVARWGKYKELFNHLDHISKMLTDPLQGPNLKPNIQLARLLFQCAWVEKEQGKFANALGLLELAERICRNHEATEESSNVLNDIWHTLGAIANETNDPAGCLQYTEKVVATKVRIANETGVRDRNLAVAFNQHSIALMMVGRLTEAENELREALEIMEKVVGNDKERMSGYALNLGFSLLLQGRLEESRAVLEEGLTVREKKFGVDDAESYRTGLYLTALGNVYLARGDTTKAEKYHFRALTQFKATLRERNHRTADLYHKMALYWIQDERSKLTEAKKYLSCALEIWKQDAKFFQPEIARSTFTMAKVLKRLGVDDTQLDCLLKSAADIRAQIPWATKIDKENLTEADFDCLITFWSR